MLKLLQDIATDTDYPVGPDNPLRPVIVNTHSPSVVRQVLDENLLDYLNPDVESENDRRIVVLRGEHRSGS